MKRISTALAAFVASIALIGTAGAGTASADADGCTYTSFPSEYVRGVVEGDGLHVDTIDVIRGKLDGAGIYDLTTRASVTAPSGQRWSFTGDSVPGKTFGRQYATVDINRSFPDGSKLCGSAYERGDIQDTVCFTIHD